MFGFIVWAVGAAIAIMLGVISHMIPVLYHLCVFFQRHIVISFERSTGRSLSIGALVFVSLLIWGALGALVGGLFLAPFVGISGVVVPALIIGAWGGSVGYQVGLQNLVFTYRQPGALPDHHPGNIGQQRVPGQAMGRQSVAEGCFADGIILGEAVDGEDTLYR